MRKSEKLGSLAGDTSPVPTHSPMVGAEVVLDPGAEVGLDLDPAFEHGVLVDLGPVAVDDLDVKINGMPEAHVTTTLDWVDDPVVATVAGAIADMDGHYDGGHWPSWEAGF